ncbi:hypothetical protein CTAYLR_003992 [Chrysophaeum taylorii]|uniref:Uncharacterized protein n=1 Tax=Chrysophaeum taylorii TaxID=2483200 RepID=A0AAD7U7S8_9STRA|nr:hypothetical protein CTAYLR_003992 [Chrysophaeum taylorii]
MRVNNGAKLLDLLFPLGNYGVGARVTRSTWNTPDCYWIVTKVKYNKRGWEARTQKKDDGSPPRHHLGKAWGSLYWRNELKGKPDRRIPGHAKGRWELVDPPKSQDRPHLTKRLHKKYYLMV